MTSQRSSNQINLIRQNLYLHRANPSSLKLPHHRRSRQIHLPPLKAAVADRQHNSTHIRRKRLSHRTSLRVPALLRPTGTSTKDEKISRTTQTGARNRSGISVR